ncbi:MAG: NHL repeat-containing protein [Planctomycetota bacterium]|jgi:sugar lactone lactonase YvrE
MQYRPVRTIDASALFTEALRAITIDADDRIVAVGDSDVRVLEAGGKPLRQWSTAAPAHGVAIAAGGAIHVGELGQVERFDPSGRLLGTWRDDARLGRVTAVGFSGPAVLLADAEARCIRRFDASGTFVADIGTDNRRRGFLIPNGIVDFDVDAGGVIHVANPGRHRVERYDRDGRLLGHFGRFDGQDPAGFQGCCNPTNLAVDDRGRVYVTEKAGPRAKVYEPDGALLAVIAADAFEPACKNMDLAVDRNGNVHVVDTVRRRILVFAPAADHAAVAPAAEGAGEP